MDNLSLCMLSCWRERSCKGLRLSTQTLSSSCGCTRASPWEAWTHGSLFNALALPGACSLLQFGGLQAHVTVRVAVRAFFTPLCKRQDVLCRARVLSQLLHKVAQLEGDCGSSRFGRALSERLSSVFRHAASSRFASRLSFGSLAAGPVAEGADPAVSTSKGAEPDTEALGQRSLDGHALVPEVVQHLPTGRLSDCWETHRAETAENNPGRLLMIC